MATKTTDSIFYDSAAQSKLASWTKYFSFPISTINNALNNTSNVPANATINSVTINVSVQFDCASPANVYFKFGIGGNGSINKELMGENQIGSLALSKTETQSKALPMSSTKPPYSVSTANGSYFTVCIYTSNIASKTFYVTAVTLTIDYTAHTHSYTETRVEPTCTTSGSITKKCSCGDTQTTTLPATGHTEITIPAVVPTCESTGLTEGKKCSVGGEILTAQQTVNALGHNYQAVVTPPTGESDGYTTHTCSHCGVSYVDSYVINKIWAGIVLSSEVLVSTLGEADEIYADTTKVYG